MHPSERLSERDLAIFLFHGVIADSSHKVRNYTRKHMRKDAFQRILKDLKAVGHALSMDEVLHHCETGDPFPPRAFAVTFDDGFENNVSVAAPILVDMRVPTTFYITTGFVEHNAMSWTDCIEYCLEYAPAGSLHLPWLPEPRAFSTAEDRIALLEEIRSEVKINPDISVKGLISSIFEQCRMEEVRSGDGPLDRKMDWSQVKELAAVPEFIVGGHSHTHAILSFLDPPALHEEIDTSLTLLRQRAGLTTRHYSYPEGLSHCYSDAVISALSDRGITCCPTAEDGVNQTGENPFRLKRIQLN